MSGSVCLLCLILCSAFVAMYDGFSFVFCFPDFSWISVATSWLLVPFLRSILFSALSSRVSNGAMTFVCHLKINIFSHERLQSIPSQLHDILTVIDNSVSSLIIQPLINELNLQILKCTILY